MGVFSDLEILEAREAGRIVIEPFDASLVQTTSVDVRLGEWFWVTMDTAQTQIISPYDEDSIKSFYSGPLRAVAHKDACESAGLALFPGIPVDQELIIIRPGENLLCMTYEQIGIREGGTSQMHAKSTHGRFNIGICDDAGWGDTGYVSWWTMEVRNRNNHRAFPLVVGDAIAQVAFYHSGNSSRSYSDGGHYQSGDQPQLSAEEWARNYMVPRTLQVRNDHLRRGHP